MDSTPIKKERGRSPAQIPDLFVSRLHQLLDDAQKECETKDLSSIISWMPSGKCFRVHQRKRIGDHILPSYFKSTKYKSFQRQLNLWGFQRIATQGPEKGAYHHPHFQRDIPLDVTKLRRVRAIPKIPAKERRRLQAQAQAKKQTQTQTQTKDQAPSPKEEDNDPQNDRPSKTMMHYEEGNTPTPKRQNSSYSVVSDHSLDQYDNNNTDNLIREKWMDFDDYFQADCDRFDRVVENGTSIKWSTNHPVYSQPINPHQAVLTTEDSLHRPESTDFPYIESDLDPTLNDILSLDENDCGPVLMNNNNNNTEITYAEWSII